MASIIIDLPLPHRALSPNARVHWRLKATLTKNYRFGACVMATAVKPLSYRPWKAATVLYQFTFRDKRRRDKDNLLASMKAATDGLADSGLVENDSQFTFLPVEILPPSKTTPGVRITVTETKTPVDQARISAILGSNARAVGRGRPLKCNSCGRRVRNLIAGVCRSCAHGGKP